MRVRKHKQNRRCVRFYRACFGFRDPYKVLCDGTFIHRMIEYRLGAANEVLSALLGGHTKVFVTRCVVAELKRLGESFAGTVLAARRLNTARCGHESLVSAADCLEAIVGADNPEHFFIATQDTGLRKKFRQVPGVPIVVAQRNSLLLEPPSEFQHQIARMSEADCLHMKEREFKLLEAREAKKKASHVEAVADVTGALDSSGDGLPMKIKSGDDIKRRNTVGVKEKPKFKRKKAKGPNPLSCKKKKKKKVDNPSATEHQVQESQVGQALGERKRSRHRKRRHHKVSESGVATG